MPYVKILYFQKIIHILAPRLAIFYIQITTVSDIFVTQYDAECREVT